MALSQPSGLCLTCRYVIAQLQRYTATPWNISYECVIRAAPMAPHATYCLRYEREPGTEE